jgi:PilZ domain
MVKRDFTRVIFSGDALIKYNGNSCIGNIENISLQGFFVKSTHDLPLNKPLEVTILHSHKSSIHLHANVVRIDEYGFGMKITDLDVNSFVCLRNVVSEQCADQDIIMNETYKMLSCIH